MAATIMLDERKYLLEIFEGFSGSCSGRLGLEITNPALSHNMARSITQWSAILVLYVSKSQLYLFDLFQYVNRNCDKYNVEETQSCGCLCSRHD